MPWAAAHHDRCKWARRSDRPHLVSIERAANTPNGTYGRPAAPKICGGEAELLGGDPTGGQTPQVDGELAGDRDDDFLFACRAACRGEERLAPLSDRVIGGLVAQETPDGLDQQVADSRVAVAADAALQPGAAGRSAHWAKARCSWQPGGGYGSAASRRSRGATTPRSWHPRPAATRRERRPGAAGCGRPARHRSAAKCAASHTNCVRRSSGRSSLRNIRSCHHVAGSDSPRSRASPLPHNVSRTRSRIRLCRWRPTLRAASSASEGIHTTTNAPRLPAIYRSRQEQSAPASRPSVLTCSP